ncbi:MAG: alpha/beta fold hydrolase [Verrucomicrobia bacterium]|jgi:pimeloyl-ACP methyl ester carboxylesterase|nr:alpha/beta fold hydrolase [Verrucomicrobiota bacterium]
MKLHFRTMGDGFPLIVLHGLLGSLDNWQPLGRRFAAHFKVFAVDLRNHGQSPHSEDVSYDAMAADLEEFMRTHGLPRAHLLGHSMGGKVAMQFALRHPDRVEKLVVVDISPRAYPPRHARTLAALLALDLHTFQRREELDAELARSVDHAEVRQFLLKNAGRDAHGGFHWKANIRGLWESYERLTVAVTSEKSCNRPALFVCGEQSDYVPAADKDLIRRLFPRAEFCVIAGAGHWVQADQPEMFYASGLKFLLPRKKAFAP